VMGVADGIDIVEVVGHEGAILNGSVPGLKVQSCF
jgi:hypothetical protein